MKNIITLILLTFYSVTSAQTVNDYKYVVVDNQYDFQKSANEFRLNELMVFELEKYGFTAIRTSEIIPLDLNRGECNALNLTVEESGSFKSNIIAGLVNCSGKVLFTTAVGIGKSKDYDKAFYSAIRNAFASFGDLEYAYNGKKDQKQTRVVDGDNVKEEVLHVDEVVKATASNEVKPAPSSVIEKQKVIEPSDSTSKPIAVRDYTDNTTTGFSLEFDESKENFTLYKNNIAVGSGRKSAAGVYLVSSATFTGIGFMEGPNFIIDYDVDGTPQRIILVK